MGHFMTARTGTKSHDWLSFHIFYSGSLDYLLLRTIAPILVATRKLDLWRMFFFVRYSEGGPHVRLRLLPQSPDGAKSLRQFVMTGIAKSLLRLQRTDKRNGHGANKKSCDNYEIRDIPYVAETERYGGPKGMRLAEEHFWHSSVACLSLLRNFPDASQDLRVAMAIQLHIPFFCGLRLGRPDMIRLLETFTLQWSHLPMLVRLEGQSDAANPENPLAWFERYFALLGSDTATEIQQFVIHCEGGGVRRPRFLKEWFRSCQSIASQLTARKFLLDLQVSGELLAGANCSKGSRVSELLLSYMHMTNNRLGVHNLNEAFLAFVLKRSLELADNDKA